ncbi:glucose-6-phosphate isomerase, partial [Clostridium perfringens]|nr:glucose-6-phosphate isomerase [Clostridium perfringens]
MEIRRPKYIHDFYNGIIEGEGVQSYGKVYKDIAFAYENNDEK